MGVWSPMPPTSFYLGDGHGHGALVVGKLSPRGGLDGAREVLEGGEGSAHSRD